MPPQSTLSALISHTLPHLSPDEVQDKEEFERYVLDSTLGQRAGGSGRAREDDWRSVVDEASRMVLRQGGGSTRDAQRFAHLSSQLRAQAIPRDKVPALNFLLSLAGTDSPSSQPSSSRTNFFPAPSALLPKPSAPPRSSAPTPVPRSPINSVPSSPRKPPKQPMAAVLAKHRAQKQAAAVSAEPSTSTLPPVPEPLLLRDIIYVLQGIDGQFVRFKPPPERVPGPRRTYKRGEIIVDGEEGQEPEELQLEDGIEFVLDGTGYSLPAPTRVLLHTLAELGWLYRKIDAKINLDGEAERRGRTVGMVEQSLHAALKGEMTEYYRLVAILEGQLDEVEDASEGGVGGGAEGMEGGLTLRRLMVWTEEVKLRMRMMGTLVEEAGEHNVGGALLTSLHSHTSNGDPFIRDFSSRLLKTLSVPFFATLSSWIYEGELRDPFAEFFVELNPAIEAGERWGDRALGEIGDFGGPGDDEDGVKAHELWEGKFGFKKEMLPGFLEESFGRKIFSTGKSLNFMKYSCQDSAWVVERNRKEGSNRTLQYADMIGLERSISLAYSIASQRLFDIFFDRFRLMDHLKALKNYLMLGKGDFVEILMESLGPSLDRPANLLYRHNLTATLETALRGSTSASDHPDTLRRLDARMLEFTQGEIGWDVFTLEYKVDAPLDTVLDPKSMQGYLKMFKHLWQIKRVEYSLNGVQRRLMTGARTFLRVEELAYDFHHTRISLQQMIFFIRQLQYYCHLEVIGCSWQVLEEFAVKKEGDLDSLIEAHRTYLERLVTKALLMSSRKSSRKETVSMLEQVRKIFRTMLQYRGAVDSLCNYALAEASRQESVRDIGRGIDSPILPSRFDSLNPSELAGIRERLEEYSAEFRALAVSLVAQLGQAPDLDMRFLAVRLNFNYHFINTSGKAES